VRTDKILIHLQFQQIVFHGYLISAYELEVQGTGNSYFFSLLPKSDRGKGNKEKDKTKKSIINILNPKQAYANIRPALQ